MDLSGPRHAVTGGSASSEDPHHCGDRWSGCVYPVITAGADYIAWARELLHEHEVALTLAVQREKLTTHLCGCREEAVAHEARSM